MQEKIERQGASRSEKLPPKATELTSEQFINACRYLLEFRKHDEGWQELVDGHPVDLVTAAWEASQRAIYEDELPGLDEEVFSLLAETALKMQKLHIEALQRNYESGQKTDN